MKSTRGSHRRLTVLERTERLHERVERAARRLAGRHAERLQCGAGCTDCCVDGLSVFAVEAELIRLHHAELLDRGTPHPPGACAFLDGAGSCRIYPHRPYVCRTQGLPLRWVAHGDGGTAVEMRDVCPLNDRPDEPLATIPARDCWTLGPVEGELATLQCELGPERPPRRVRLRDLFAASRPGPE